MHFGCGIFYSRESITNPLQILGAFDPKNDDWIPWRNFFTSFKLTSQFEFGSSNMVMNGLMTGKIKEINIDVLQVNVYKGDQILKAENVLFEEAIRDFVSTFNNFDIPSIFDRIPVLKGVPITPLSKGLRCMGMTPRNAVAEIQDRFLRIAFDLKTTQADKKCLFETFENDEVKFDRWAKDASKKGYKDLQNVFNNAKKSLFDNRKQYNPLKRRK